MISKILSAFRRRYNDRRLIEFDGSDLLQKYGHKAAARALEFEAKGRAYLLDGRREGHWLRVARCIARRPLPTRSDTVLN